MIRFPNCKINLGLRILRKRSDGYHDIDSAMLPAGWCDILEIVPAADGITGLVVTGLAVAGPEKENLCYKAWQLMNEHYGIQPVKMHLHKIIPTGAGLGGGSADAAFALGMLNEISGLWLQKSELLTLAEKLGMDCPFFIANTPALVSSRGEILKAIDIDLSGYYLVIVKPPFGVNTALAYQHSSPADDGSTVAEILKMPVAQWRHLLRNDFEKPVFEMYPEIENIKNQLYEAGAIYASMSGSGSAVYGLFEHKPLLRPMAGSEIFEELLGRQHQ